MTLSPPSSALIWIVHRQPEFILQALSPMTNSGNCRIRTLRTTSRISDYLNKEQPDLVIINRHGGSFDGLDVCRALKQQPSSSQLSVILVGLDPQSSDLIEAVDAGADSFLCDPLNPVELMARVRLALRDGQQRAGVAHHYDSSQATLMAELKSARMMSDNIVSNLTHELKTPLLQIKISVKELKTQGISDVDQTGKLIEHAYAATLRLESVVQKLFQFSTAMRSQKTEPFLIQDVMRAVKLQIERDLTQHNHPVPTIYCTFEPNALPAVSSERLSITQVLTQLTDNAAKFSDYHEPIVLHAAQVGDYVDVSVQDFGIGIDQSQHEAIFAPYYQVDCSVTRRYNGTGLGLAIVKLILDRLSIPFKIDSALGKGTVFHFLLPVADFGQEPDSHPIREPVPVH